MALLLAFLVAVGVTMALIPPLIKLAPRFHFVDVPQARKVHTQLIPRVGGIAMAVGLLIAWMVWGHAEQATPMIAAIGVLLAFGVWDDRATLSAGTKFAGQISAVLIVMIWGHVGIDSLTLVDRYVIPIWLAAPLTFVFLIGATNAVNLADGLDGLAGGTTMMCLAGLALLAFTVGNVFVGGLALLMIGAVLGFLRYNTYPARVFMGDSGSQLLGFSAAVLSVMLTQGAAPLSSALPLLLLGVPIIDTATVMISRILAGRSPFKADRNHLHHRLLALGFDHHEAVMVIYFAQGVFFVLAWFLRYESDLFIVGAFVVLALAILWPLHRAVRAGWRWRAVGAQDMNRPSALKARIEWLAEPARLPRWSCWLIAVAMATFSIAVLVSAAKVSRDAGAVALGTAVVLLVSLLLRWNERQLGWVEKIGMYLSAAVVVYADEWSAGNGFGYLTLTWMPIVLIAIAVAMRLRLQQDRRFVVTPLDVLVIIIAVAIPNLPGSIASPQALGASVAKLIVMFYGVETLNVVAEERWRSLTVAALSVLMVTVVRAF